MTNIYNFPNRHHHHDDSGDNNDRCLVCEIFSLITHRFPEIRTEQLMHALVECTATVIATSAKEGQLENAARIIGEDIEHVTRQIHAFGLPHAI
jgi:hypothetical protein